MQRAWIQSSMDSLSLWVWSELEAPQKDNKPWITLCDLCAIRRGQAPSVRPYRQGELAGIACTNLVRAS